MVNTFISIIAVYFFLDKVMGYFCSWCFGLVFLFGFGGAFSNLLTGRAEFMFRG